MQKINILLVGEIMSHVYEAGLAQSVERQALNLVVVGSSPTAGDRTFCNSGYDDSFTPSRSRVQSPV